MADAERLAMNARRDMSIANVDQWTESEWELVGSARAALLYLVGELEEARLEIDALNNDITELMAITCI